MTVQSRCLFCQPLHLENSTSNPILPVTRHQSRPYLHSVDVTLRGKSELDIPKKKAVLIINELLELLLVFISTLIPAFPDHHFLEWTQKRVNICSKTFVERRNKKFLIFPDTRREKLCLTFGFLWKIISNCSRSRDFRVEIKARQGNSIIQDRELLGNDKLSRNPVSYRRSRQEFLGTKLLTKRVNGPQKKVSGCWLQRST